MSRRTETNADADTGAVEQLLAALDDLVDYGTAWSNREGGITVPARARDALGLPKLENWRIFGSPELGIAILLGPRRSAHESLAFSLSREPDEDGPQSAAR